MVANMKLAFTNMPSRHNSAQVIQERLKFKRVVITFRLAYVSKLFPNGFKIIQLLFSK